MLKKIKKISCVTILVGSLISTVSIPVFAELNTRASAPFNFSFNSLSNGLGYVDGSKNGSYHTLIANNQVTLRVNSKSGSGDINVSLKRSNITYGIVNVDSIKDYKFNAKPEVTSNYYYLHAIGSKPNVNYKASGYIVH